MQPRFGKMEDLPDDTEEETEDRASFLPKRNPLVERIEEGLETVVGGGIEKAIDFADRTIVPVVGKMFEKKKEEHEAPLRTFEYPEGYEGLKSPQEQLSFLEREFPHLSTDAARDLFKRGSLDFNAPRHKGIPHAEGWAFLPPWQRIASSYEAAVKIVLDKLAERMILDPLWWEEWKDRFRLKEREHTKRAYAELERLQEGSDVLVTPVQFGRLHRGLSPKKAQEGVERGMSREFGLNTFSVALLILMHPERFKESGDLWVQCIGDELDSDGDGSHEHLPSFGKANGKVHFMDSYDKMEAFHSGGVTGFVWEESERQRAKAA